MAPSWKLGRGWKLPAAQEPPRRHHVCPEKLPCGPSKASRPAHPSLPPNTHPISLDAHVSFEARKAIFTLHGGPERASVCMRKPTARVPPPRASGPQHQRQTCWAEDCKCPAPCPLRGVFLSTLCILRFWLALQPAVGALQPWSPCLSSKALHGRAVGSPAPNLSASVSRSVSVSSKHHRRPSSS